MWNQAEHLSQLGRHLLNRRGFLSNSATALSSIALANLLDSDHLLAGDSPIMDPSNPYAPRQTHHKAKANNVILVFCAGAVSQLETWDYNPELGRATTQRRSRGHLPGAGRKSRPPPIRASATGANRKMGIENDSSTGRLDG